MKGCVVMCSGGSSRVSVRWLLLLDSTLGSTVNAVMGFHSMDKSIGQPEIGRKPQWTAKHWDGLVVGWTMPFRWPPARLFELRPSWRCWAVGGRPAHYAGYSPVCWLSQARRCIASVYLKRKNENTWKIDIVQMGFGFSLHLSEKKRKKNLVSLHKYNFLTEYFTQHLREGWEFSRRNFNLQFFLQPK